MADAWLEELSKETCLDLLRNERIGRIAFVVDNDPVILPVNFKLVEPPSGPIISIGTRPGNTIERAPTSVAFEVDSFDVSHHEGWSVLVRGELVHAAAASAQFRERYDPDSWLTDRDAWLLIDPWAITGRSLHGAEAIWPVRPGEYL
ncbi:MAG TPA: pyridoxamine 5'-phosphate oxidase family protein [Acidimicrobiia bacterium]|nr:pyridoxamine 5'-phosphate oxidase family protein [Acidimicrobiia bacterium]